jgi:hypothetical protein
MGLIFLCFGGVEGRETTPEPPVVQDIHLLAILGTGVITMKTLARWAIALGTTALVAAGALGAAPLPSTPEEVLKLPPEFTGADEDEDGYINPQEAEAIPGLSAVFALLDHDQNCGIDLEEYGHVPNARQR